MGAETKDIAVGRVRDMGELTLKEGTPERPDEYRISCAIVIQFSTQDALRKALHDGIVKFGPFDPGPILGR